LYLQEMVKMVKKIDGGFSIETDKETYQAKTVLVATGSHRRKLEIPGADKYEHKGITYCASCDGPLFTDQDVVIIGGGNAALESAAQLLAYTKSVTLLNRSDKLRGDEVTIEKYLSNQPNNEKEFLACGCSSAEIQTFKPTNEKRESNKISGFIRFDNLWWNPIPSYKVTANTIYVFKRMGALCLSADDIVLYHLKTKKPLFDFVMLSDRAEKKRGNRAAVYTGTKGEKVLTELMK